MKILNTKQQNFLSMIAKEMVAMGLTKPTEENMQLAMNSIHNRAFCLSRESAGNISDNIAMRLWRKAQPPRKTIA